MIAGTKLNNFKQLEFIARISLSGDPLDRSETLAASVIIETKNTKIYMFQNNKKVNIKSKQ